MSIITEIQGVKSRTFVIAVFDLLFLVLPGLMVVFLYQNSLFMSLDWTKLTLLSAAITLPFTLINTMIIAIQTGKHARSDEDLFLDFSVGIIMTGISIYIAIGCLYLFGKSLRSIFIFVGIIEVLLCVWTLFSKRPNKK